MVRRCIYLILIAIGIVSCKTPEARQPVQSKSGSFIQASAERNKVIYDEEKVEIEKIIANDSLKDYITSENGFWYFYNVRDTSATQLPKIGDVVKFSYDLKHLDGDIILSEKENGVQGYRIDKSNQELISGIREGIKLMREGEKVTFIFPSYKAYGYYGIEQKLGTNVPVISTITLHTIEQSNEN